MNKKRTMILCIIFVALILIVIVIQQRGREEMSNIDLEMNPIEGLLVPTQQEAAPHMINQFSYDLYLAIENGLATSEGFSDRYLNMQALYRKALEQYLVNQSSQQGSKVFETFED